MDNFSATLILEHIPQGVLALDDSLQVCFANTTAKMILGSSPDDPLEGTLLDFLKPQDRDSTSNQLENLRLEKTRLVTLNRKFKRLDDEWIDIDLRICRLAETEDESAHFLCTLVDITAETYVERFKDDSMALLGVVFDTIPGGVFYKGIDGKYLGCNESFSKMMGRPREDFLGISVFDLFPPDLAAIYYKQDQALFERPGKQTYEAQIETGDGERIEVLFHKAAYKDSSGRVAGLVGIMFDITDRKQAEEQTRLLETALNATASGVAVTDREGTIIWTNPAFSRITGYSFEELKGENPRVLKSGQHDNDFYRELWKTVLAGETWSGQFINKRKDGTLSYDESLITPVLNDHGEIKHFIAIKQEIGERLQLESQLRQAQKIEAIGTLAAGIAHEINTPTQYVSDNFQFIKESFGDLKVLLLELVKERSKIASAEEAEQALLELAGEHDIGFVLEEIPRALDESAEGLERIAAIVKAMKAFSHPGTEERVSTDLNKSISDTVTVCRNEWKYVADLNLRLADDIPPVICFPGEINQVWLNLIVNAAQAIGEKIGKSPKERGFINVSTSKENGWAVVRIEDSGGGIPDSIKDRIFDPFFTTKAVGFGTGQGLAISHSVITEKHQGVLEFESVAGQGTTFTVKLPLEISN